MLDRMDQHQTPLPDATTFTAAKIAGIKDALVSLETEGSIPYEEVTAWLDSLDTDTPLSEPQPRKV